MFSKSIVPVALALFASSAVSSPLALPSPQNNANSQTFGWDITNFYAKCDIQVDNTCTYYFNIDSQDSTDDSQHISAYCGITNAGFHDESLNECENHSGIIVTSVKASLPLRPILTDTKTTLLVQVEFKIDSDIYYISASHDGDYQFWTSLKGTTLIPTSE